MKLDGRALRIDDGVVAVALLGGFVFKLEWIIPVWAVIELLNALSGPQYGPVLRIATEVVLPRAGGSPTAVDGAAARFAWTVEAGVLSVATLLWLGGESGIAWILSLVVAAVAALGSTTGLHAIVELYHRRGK
jgi:predicted anti-sigma-YlaC factor YlaD